MTIRESNLIRIETQTLGPNLLRTPALRKPLRRLSIERLRIIVGVLCADWFKTWRHDEFQHLVEEVRGRAVAKSSIRSVRWWTESTWRKLGTGRYCPTPRAAELALAWLRDEDVIIERNWIINCDRGIGFGLTSYDGGHNGGASVIRNNFVYNDGAGANTDVCIGLGAGTVAGGAACCERAVAGGVDIITFLFPPYDRSLVTYEVGKSPAAQAAAAAFPGTDEF